MRRNGFFKKEQGFTGVDITISVIIILLFVSVITGLFYNISIGSASSEAASTANSYLIRLFQKIDEIPYSQITEDSKAEVPDIFLQKLQLEFGQENVQVKRGSDNTYEKGFLIEISVSNYKEQTGNENKMDVIKIIQAKITYKIGGKEKVASSQRIKMKEQELQDKTGITPMLTEGMTPVKYIEDGNYWQVTDIYDTEWFDYSKGRWANVMLQDEMDFDAATGRIMKEGSMFVYIPRFAYKIPEESYHTAKGSSISIKFLNLDNTCKDGSNISVQTAINSTVVGTAINSTTDYILHPAFAEQIEGFWIGKYEASHQDAGTTSAQMGSGSLKVKSGVTSWRSITILDAWKKANQMNANNNMYGLQEDSIPSLITNHQWDAVSYLSYSIYGKNTKVEPNLDTNMITGAGEEKNSTTGNKYGVYDMCGGAWEYVLGYLKDVTGNTYINGLASLDNKYKTTYVGNNTDAQTNYNANSLSLSWEYSTSGTGNNAWQNTTSGFLTATTPFFVRGGAQNASVTASVFAYMAKNGAADSNISFRPVILKK